MATATADVVEDRWMIWKSWSLSCYFPENLELNSLPQYIYITIYLFAHSTVNYSIPLAEANVALLPPPAKLRGKKRARYYDCNISICYC